jgi:hypothetical protein
MRCERVIACPQSCFDRLYNEFVRDGYEIWIRNEDYDRHISVEVIKILNSNLIKNTVKLKGGDREIVDTLPQELVNQIRENLSQNQECNFNYQSQS